MLECYWGIKTASNATIKLDSKQYRLDNRYALELETP